METIAKTDITRRPNGSNIFELFSSEYKPIYESNGKLRKTIVHHKSDFVEFISEHPELDIQGRKSRSQFANEDEELGLLRGQVFDVESKIDLLTKKVNELLDQVQRLI